MSDLVTRLNTALEGRYRIERELGEGGMATVYLADDLKHERKVALKVLKPELAAVVGAERFLAEIKTTANLQHPHILPLFDSGEADGFLYYAMPLVEGESLRARLDRDRQLPVEEAVAIAKAVGRALHHAHGRGVIHRDIKPGNILLQDGQPVVADFGIALAVGTAGATRLTETGMSVGTPYYMSPEQATGDTALGPATDVYALGCVLYEMLTGDPPYIGSTAQAVLAQVIAGVTASAMAKRTAVPPHVDAAIRKALERLPADRFSSAHGFVTALSNPDFRHGALAPSGVDGSRIWQWSAIAASVVAAALAVALAWTTFAPEPLPRLARFETPFRDGQEPTGPMRFTTDGSALVYIGPGPTGVGSQLWVRRWADLEATPVPGTEGVTSFAVSRNGREIAVSAQRTLSIVPLDGASPPRVLVDEAGGVSDWGEDGHVYFLTPSPDNNLARVPYSGGPVDTLAQRSEGEILHGHLRLLPGEAKAVFQVWYDRNATDAEIWVLDLETRDRHVLTAGSNPDIASTGHLLFGTTDGALFAVPLDTRTAQLSGPPTRLLHDVGIRSEFDVMDYAISTDGSFIYRTGGASDTQMAELVWVSRSGEAAPVDPLWRYDPGLDGGYAWILSPDGRRIATTRVVDGNWDIWIKQLPDGPFDRLTFSEAEERYPVWTADGQSITYSSGEYGDYNVWQRRADGADDPTLLIDPEPPLTQKHWSPDGEWLVVVNSDPTVARGEQDIWGVEPGASDSLVPLVTSEDFFELMPRISPDGRWIAYYSNETGAWEIYVRPFPDTGSGRFRVSRDGGHTPIWSHDGSELFFVTPDRRLLAAQVSTSRGFEVRSRDALFTLGPEYLINQGYGFVDVAADGRFLMGRLPERMAGRGSEFVLVQGFAEQLRQIVPEG
jgi:serine/threonine-protein kinase